MSLSPDDVLRLMDGMAKSGTHGLEYDGLKLSRAIDRAVPTAVPAATNISMPAGAPPPPATPENAMKAVQAARMQARANAEAKLSQAQARTQKARRKAAGGIGAPGSSAIDAIYKDALSTPVPPPTSALDKPNG